MTLRTMELDAIRGSGLNHYHRGHEGAAGRISERGCGAGDGQLAVLQRLAHYLQHLPLELRQLVQEEHPTY